MKKHLLYATLFVGALSSCSKDNDRVSAPEAENGDLQAIELGVSSGQNFTAATRGLGMVGGLSTPDGVMIANNEWEGQTLWVLMRESETISNVTKNELGYTWDGIPNALLDNQQLTAPTSGEKGYITSYSQGETHTPYYYFPVTGNYDFYGYHVDDAAVMGTNTNEENAPAITVEDDYEYVTFTIDGTQDLMAAKADFYTDVVNSSADENQKAELAGIKEPISYSAFAARRNVQPTLVFNHLLTKLNFIAVNMNKPENYEESNPKLETGGDRDGNTIKPVDTPVITVTGIEITGTKAGGQLTVSAAKGSAEFAGNINWTEGSEATLKVRNNSDTKTGHKTADSDPEPTDGADGDLDDLVAVDLKNYNVDYNIGAGLLLRPNAEADAVYTGKIYFKQVLNTEYENGAYKTETVKQEVDLTIKASDIVNAVEGVEGFAAGYAYNVYIKVWGIQQIEIEAVLTPWEMGGNVTDTPEDEVFGPEDITAEKQAALDLILETPTSEADYVALLNWGEKYFVSAAQLATVRGAYNLDGDTDVDAADWAAYRLNTKMDAEATRAKVSSDVYVDGCDALIEYLSNKTITFGGKTAEYTPVLDYAKRVAPLYISEDIETVNAAWQAIVAKKAELEAKYAKETALEKLATEMTGNTEKVTTDGCDALIEYLKQYDIMGSEEEEELVSLYAAYKYKNEGITLAGVNAILESLTPDDDEEETTDDPEP